ncbi:MAG: PIN domain-containing protein [Bacteroidales bacterium]
MTARRAIRLHRKLTIRSASQRRGGLASRAPDVPSDDPADRFLAATARVYELTLVTADARLRRIPHVTVLPNS